ncbi:MAG: substrate-binding periplasmic protein [bacterium]
MNIKRTILALCIFLLPQAAYPEETIHISTGEFTPWTSDRLEHGGFINHVISEAFKLEGYHVKFTYYPWKRTFEVAKDGKKFQATSYWYQSEERAQHYHYSDVLQTDSTVFFHLKQNPLFDWQTLDDLKGIRIGATRAYTYTPDFWDAQKSGRLNIQIANSDEVNLDKLINGRIDMFPAERVLGQQLLNQIYGPEIAETVTYHAKPLIAPTGHLLVSRQLEDGEELVSKFNNGLNKLKQNGRYSQLQQNLMDGKYLKQ